MEVDKQTTLAEEWPSAGVYTKSIKTEFSLFVAGMIVVMMTLAGWFVTNEYIGSVTRHTAKELLVQARSLGGVASSHMISSGTPDVLMLNNICNKLLLDNTDLYWSGISNIDGNFIAHTEMKKVAMGEKLNTLSSWDFGQLLHEGEAFEIRNDTVFISIPLLEEGVNLGTLGLAASMEQIKTARKTSIIAILSIALLLTVVGIPVSLMVLRRKLEPISTITDCLKNMNFEHLEIDIPYSSKNELGYLSDTLQVMGAKLKHSQTDMIERERIAQELQMAREIQTSLLPKSYPQLDCCSINGAYRSCREVGGDYYDFIDYNDDEMAVVIADVSGKSLPAMLVMLLTRDVIRKLSLTVRNPVDLLCATNKELFRSTRDDTFVTMFVGLLNKKTGRLVYASAGHTSTLTIDGVSGAPSLVKTKGFPVGLVGPEMFDKRIESAELVLKSNDWLILYTDGINEAQDSIGSQYGVDRLKDIVSNNRSKSPKELIVTCIDDLSHFVGEADQYDDQTLLALKWSGDLSNSVKKNLRNDVYVQ